MQQNGSGSGIRIVSLAFLKNQDKKVRDIAVTDLGRSLEDTGFVFLSDHGIEASFLNRCYSLFQEFFSLSVEIKKKYHFPEIFHQRGWTPPYTEKSLYSDKPDAKENLFFMLPDETSGMQEMRKKYPSIYFENIWPEEVLMEEECRQLAHLLYVCGRQVLQGIDLYLQTIGGEIVTLIELAPHVLRPLRYPAVSKEDVANVVWGGAHTDLNFLTLLPSARGKGLWIRKRNGEWIPGSAPEGCILAQAADMLERITCGRFLSAMHEVRVPEEGSADRYSCAYFMHVRSDLRLSPIYSCKPLLKKDEIFEIMTAGEFLQKRLEDIGLAVKST